MERTVLAIDPGTDKCGMALVRRKADGKLEILWKAIAPRAELLSYISQAREVSPYAMLIVGNGTGSRSLVSDLNESLPGSPILLVDEKDTSWQARERYWEYNPRRGWRRLIMASMQTPPEPVDDFVALILAERVLLA